MLTLSADVGILLHVAVNIVGIDVVRGGVSISQRQHHARVVIAQDVGVAILGQIVASPGTDRYLMFYAQSTAKGHIMAKLMYSYHND